MAGLLALSAAPGPPSRPAGTPPPDAAGQAPARLLWGLSLDLNRADERSLEVLPGVGPARAGAIVAERCRRPFASVAELTRVRGIGPRTRAALEPYLSVGAAPEARCPGLH